MPHGIMNALISDVVVARKMPWGDYQLAAEERIGVLQGFFQNQLIGYIEKLVDPVSWKQIYQKRYLFDTSENVMSDIINKVAKLYIEQPIRAFTNKKGDEDPGYIEMMTKSTQTKLNKVMNESLRFSLAVGGVLVRIVLRPENQWQFNVITPGFFVPQIDLENPSKLVGVEMTRVSRDVINRGTEITEAFSIDPTNIDNIYQLRPPFWIVVDANRRPTTIMMNGVRRLAVFQGDDYPFIDSDGKPYLPLVITRIENESNELLNQATGLDLWQSTMLACWFKTQEEWLARMQSHGQWVVTGKVRFKHTKNILDPTVPLVIPAPKKEDVKVEFQNLQTDITRFKQLIINEYESEANKRGWGIADFKPTFAAQSGAALAIQNEQKDEFLLKLALEFSIPENEIAIVMGNLWNKFASVNGDITAIKQIRVKDDFEIKYGAVTKKDLSDLENDLNLLGAGLTSKVRIFAKQNNISKKQALKTLQEIEKENAPGFLSGGVTESDIDDTDELEDEEPVDEEDI